MQNFWILTKKATNKSGSEIASNIILNLETGHFIQINKSTDENENDYFVWYRYTNDADSSRAFFCGTKEECAIVFNKLIDKLVPTNIDKWVEISKKTYEQEKEANVNMG